MWQAETVVKSLRDLAAAGHTVVMSIHQPRSSVWAMLDDVLLMADGNGARARACVRLCGCLCVLRCVHPPAVVCTHHLVWYSYPSWGSAGLAASA
jgi:hypothetical protein